MIQLCGTLQLASTDHHTGVLCSAYDGWSGNIPSLPSPLPFPLPCCPEAAICKPATTDDGLGRRNSALRRHIAANPRDGEGIAAEWDEAWLCTEKKSITRLKKQRREVQEVSILEYSTAVIITVKPHVSYQTVHVVMW